MEYISIRLPKCASLIVAAIGLFAFIGCLQTTYGEFAMDSKVRDDFRSGTVPGDLKYFYTGRQSMPYAIMGIDPGYTVPSRFWIQFKPDPEQLKSMSSNMYGQDRYDPYGFNILDPDGVPIGIWFSNLRFPSVSVDQESRTVDVVFKNPESYDEY